MEELSNGFPEGFRKKKSLWNYRESPLEGFKGIVGNISKVNPRWISEEIQSFLQSEEVDGKNSEAIHASFSTRFTLITWIFQSFVDFAKKSLEDILEEFPEEFLIDFNFRRIYKGITGRLSSKIFGTSEEIQRGIYQVVSGTCFKIINDRFFDWTSEGIRGRFFKNISEGISEGIHGM